MAHFHVFNGDADGLCGMQQMRLAHPHRDATIVTGPKRDIRLLARVPAQSGDRVSVFDISIAQNREALLELLNRGVTVDYFAQHAVGAPIAHEYLHLHVDPSAEVCTSLLVDRHLQGRYAAWAIVGAFGHGLDAQATRYCENMGLSPNKRRMLQRLGELLNYNSYGDCDGDLLYAPSYLCERMAPFDEPTDFIDGQREIVQSLAMCYLRDTARMAAVFPLLRPGGIVFRLPEESRSMRVSGLLTNRARSLYPNQSVAVIRRKNNGNYAVSVRSPDGDGADRLCGRFPSGGGRRAAAGINDLPAGQVDLFLREFDEAFQVQQFA